ncbi:protein phosphatase 2C domain-containing protein [Verrucomicrobium sp. BvORR106]|uniref:PP2C family protein-serine/threonine phosphatase n=1 Tax=Verrucomicrobium sp. BvORR106 TaxID=1403819 RepID=UPI00068B2C0F|nr:protein phosphatase 2C domain-containing protein [Verrucomicrobium sp. BvORR106]
MIESAPESEITPQHIRWSGMTHRGRVRANNEDTFLALTFDAHEVRYLGKIGESTLKESDFIFAVSDGMGGANSGEFASRIAVEKITRLLPRSFKFSAQRLVPGFADILSLLFDSIHAELTRMGRVYDECSGMGATLSLGWFTPGWMYFGHLGDSRIYYFPKDGEMTQVSHDHSHVGWLRRQGKINEREARTHPRRNVLQQALGAGHQLLDPQVGAVSCQPGDRFLFCTDGLTDGLWDRAIKELVLDPPAKLQDVPMAQRLVETALAESGRDNITALVVEVM